MPVLQDLLSWADNKRRVMGRNLSDLVSDPMGTVPRLAETAGETLTQHFQDPMNFVGGGVGHIAYHGSPHKFDKFSLDKIGTGEGAQAYGHGLYLAESPDVGVEYAKNLANRDMANQGRLNAHANAQRLAKVAGDPAYAIDDIRFALGNDAAHPQKQLLTDTLQFLESGAYKNPLENAGHLYKTDIPDEAVARMLDWDKPLSQQHPDVLERIKQSPSVMDYMAKEEATRQRLNASHPQRLEKLNSAGTPYDESRMSGKEAWTALAREYGNQRLVSERMQELGIPGIRYLDGGSRSAGQGSSNFVAFDPEMIRILERNGQATGLQPWQPGEYRSMSDLMNVRTD